MQCFAATNVSCPLDGLPLAVEDGSLRCASRHTFDRAREGYWNLLLVQHKASREPGDGKEMVAARRRILDAGHFAPIAQRLFEMIAERAADALVAPTIHIVDAGCGEGYYLDRLAVLATASASAGTLQLAGYDVSKFAVQAAARRKSPVTWLVANNRNPPFPDASVDILLCLFGFPVWQGFTRVLRPGGVIVMVDPGPDHLLELREIIYPVVERSGPPSLDLAEATGFRLTREETLRFSVELPSAAAIGDLVAMTPHAFRIGAAGRDGLAARATLTTSADVAIRILQKS